MTIPSRLKSLLAPPVIEKDGLRDEDLTRTAGLLYQLAWAIVVISLIAIPLVIISGSKLIMVVVILTALLATILTLYLAKRGKVQQASMLLVLAGWTLFTVASFAQGGLESVLSVMLIAFILIAAILLGERFAIGMGVLTILAYTGMLIAQNAGWISAPLSPITPFTRWAGMVSILLLIAYLFYMTTRSLQTAIDSSRASTKELLEANRQLENIRTTLEARVAERTSDLEQRARQLQASAEIVGAVASIRDLDELLQKLTHLIADRLDFYHVGLFMVDESGEMLVLKAANSPGGQQLIRRNYQNKTGQAGIIGVAARTLRPYHAKNVYQDAYYLALAELPETRLEIALPLISGSKLLGVLDVHSQAELAFASEDVTILQILADQVAIAIENAQLFKENQRALEAIERAYGSVSQEAWRRLLHTQPDFGYLCKSPDRLAPVAGPWSLEMVQASQKGEILESGSILALPIKMREEVIGAIKLRKRAGSGAWTQDEIELMETLNDQLSIALESARLYEETRRRAERERLTGEITAKIRASNDPQTILKTAVHELRQALQADRAQLILGVSSTPQSGQHAQTNQPGEDES